MQIKSKIKKILVLGAVLFLFLQAVVIFASPRKGSYIFDQTTTKIYNEPTSQAADGFVEDKEQTSKITFADLLEPREDVSENKKREGTKGIQDAQQVEQEQKDEKEEMDKEDEDKLQVQNKYPLHTNIITTYFWAGEGASEDNGDISNVPSAWDEKWMKHFGGEDDPDKRNGYFPAKFTPKENPFYFALPYSDFGSDGDRRSSVWKIIPWAKSKKWKDSESMCKNQWIKIIKKGKAAYAQWEDVGPYKTKDSDYVFGAAKPKNKNGSHAGLDVSPAVRDYLGLSDVDKVDWQFIEASAVPNGPWKQIITHSQIYWK